LALGFTSPQQEAAMSISSINPYNTWNPPSPAISAPDATTLDDSLPAAGGAGLADPSGTAQSNATTGSSNPFESLAAALQAWLNQSQSQAGAAPASPAANGTTPSSPTNGTTSANATADGGTPFSMTGGLTSLGDTLSQDMSQALQAYGSLDGLAGSAALFGMG
jgi:hypothetical protein